MELVRVPTLTQEVPYAYAAVAPGGTVYAAGACPLDEDGEVVAPGDVAAQAERVMRNLRAGPARRAVRPRRRPQDDGVRRVVGSRRPGRGLERRPGRLRRPRPSEHAARRRGARVPRPARRGGGGRRTSGVTRPGHPQSARPMASVGPSGVALRRPAPFVHHQRVELGAEQAVDHVGRPTGGHPDRERTPAPEPRHEVRRRLGAGGLVPAKHLVGGRVPRSGRRGRQGQGTGGLQEATGLVDQLGQGPVRIRLHEWRLDSGVAASIAAWSRLAFVWNAK